MTPQEMQNYRVDRTGWDAGPWDEEPDRVDFEHHGLPCLLLRNHWGTWCGYVGVPPSHPAYGVDYNGVDVDVHGGLTYAAQCEPPICHIPKPGESDDVWWLGFDCGHLWDQTPGRQALLRSIDAWTAGDEDGETYRTMGYARAETERLAEQLIKSA